MSTKPDVRFVYEFKLGSFIVWIFENKCRGHNSYEAWLRHEDYGIMEFMFGADPKDTQLSQFVNIVEYNLPDYISQYKENNFDEGDF